MLNKKIIDNKSSDTWECSVTDNFVFTLYSTILVAPDKKKISNNSNTKYVVIYIEVFEKFIEIF